MRKSAHRVLVLGCCMPFSLIPSTDYRRVQVFLKDGIAVITDYPVKPDLEQTSLLLKDTASFIDADSNDYANSDNANWCDAPQGNEEVTLAFQCLVVGQPLPSEMTSC